jgi:hypothetical protein
MLLTVDDPAEAVRAHDERVEDGNSVQEQADDLGL